MLFEDAHWADPTTLEVLHLLIDRVKTVPLLVVLTHRPEFQSRWSGHGHVGALNLSKLTRAQSAAMVATLAGKALPVPLREQILTRTDGVPLFVEELTRSILESGELKDVGDHYDYEGSARAVTIPATLRDALMARLDRFVPVKERLEYLYLYLVRIDEWHRRCPCRARCEWVLVISRYGHPPDSGQPADDELARVYDDHARKRV
jgi:predicted ATPase